MDYLELTSSNQWNKYFLSELKNKGYQENELSWKSQNNTYRFIHFSPKIKSIIESGKINISGGGLFGVVYVTPVHEDGYVHNLGQYIFDVELPQSLNTDKVECLVFEMSEKQYKHSLSKGKINYIFESGYYAKANSIPEVLSIYNKVIADIDKLLNQRLNSFSKELKTFFSKFPELKHIYFESLNEYLYTRQDSKSAFYYAEKGEVYAKEVKNYLFEATPQLKTKFSTAYFVTDTEFHLANLREKSQIISRFNSDDFATFMCARITFYLRTLRKNPKAILGRLMLKNSPESFRYILEQRGINLILEDKKDIVLFQYDTIPKGEMGILPNDKTIVYKGIYSNGRVKLINQVDVVVLPHLISKNMSVLRVK